MSDLTELIRNALKERDAATATAVTDLHEVTRQFSDAIAATTNGAATFALEPLDPSDTGPGHGADPFALLLCWNQDERVIRVAELSLDGYPIMLFDSLANWQNQNRYGPAVQNRAEMETYFRDLVSARDSDVVTMLRFIIGNTAPRQPAGAA